MDNFSTTLWALVEWGQPAMALLGVGSLTIGTATTVAYGLFKWLGEKSGSIRNWQISSNCSKVSKRGSLNTCD
ncbi:hypothetical protein CCGE525_14885 [Rhizobium jaguaris]|uniref:Uncharacterized protein n=1 Tax=Rhizobium jaguaris TaxID=1312183 RepID=A0A387FNA0_9HYPH|nr:hypothetical protein CCGE525_14885 [Rhizobium jaguaris]